MVRPTGLEPARFPTTLLKGHAAPYARSRAYQLRHGRGPNMVIAGPALKYKGER